jgi:ubiquinone/menaquinone biosynthesis C-methylase UbiE
LQEGAVVADVGSGAGYFTLKLSRLVGPRGRVVAVDIRKLPLFFLWIRARTSGRYNVRTIVGDQEDPRLPIGLVDAVLISNTYHEFQNPGSMLVHLSKSLRRGGRLVVLDHIATPLDERKDHPHELSPDIVDDQLREKGFEILERQDRFIVRSKGELWWLIEARLN